MHTLELRVRSERAALEHARQAMVDFVAILNPSETVIYRLELVLEEMVTNFFLHALPPGSHEELRISVHLSAEEIELVFDDGCAAFNPLRAKASAMSTSLAGASDGGRGIALARHAADRWHYERVAGRNRSTIGVELRDDARARHPR
jgi:anti-sigma regulatory factor (Ser/Thr protein kinase)